MGDNFAIAQTSAHITWWEKQIFIANNWLRFDKSAHLSRWNWEIDEGEAANYM